MRGVSRTGLAALLVCVLVLTGSMFMRPVIPSDHSAPWRWLAPLRLQSVEAAGEEINPLIWGMELVLLGVLAKATLEGLTGLATDYVADYLRDAWDAYTSKDGTTDPAGGGGGLEFWP